MALVSFRLRRSDDVGSYLREENRLDSAIRSDNYIEPALTTGTSTFSANIFNLIENTVIDPSRPGGSYLTYEALVDLEWTLETALVSEPSETSPIEIHIVINQFGEPLTVQDGTTVFTCNSTNFVNSYRHSSILYKPGTWLYYGFFIHYSDGTSDWFERAADVRIQLPRYYESVDNLWQRIPEYYRGLDYDQGNSHLYKFLQLFGWELDRARTLIDSLISINDPLTSPTPALDAVAKQLGVPITSLDVGTARLRNVLSNIFNLRQRKGTVNGITSFISALSGCRSRYDADTDTFYVYSQRVNLLSDPKFRQQDLSFYVGTPSTLDRTPFTLRKSDGGTALRNPNNNDDALRGTTTNPLSLGELAAYATTTSANAAASVGWGVYTYGANFGASASVPNIESIIYDGQNISSASVSVVMANGDGIKIEIPNDVTGSQVVVVYGRKPFTYRNDVTYYSSFNCNLSGASFVNFRFITNSNVINYLEIEPPDSVGNYLYYDSWNTESAANQEIFLYGNGAYYNASAPGLATLGRFSLQHPQTTDVDNVEQVVVPALVFFADPGDTIIVSKWLVEPNAVGEYFDGDNIFGGFIQQANQPSVVGIADYRWGPNGGSNNQDFSYYTLDYARAVDTVTRVVSDHLIPVNMIGNYTISWNTIPGD